MDEAQLSHHSQKLRSQIDKIYAKLTETFENTTSPSTEIDRSLKAMRFITLLSEGDIAVKSANLFYIIRRTPVSIAYSEKWEASRLALRGAYKWDNVLPVEDPQAILAFLSHHFALVEKGEDHDEPIQNALHALAHDSTPKTAEALKSVDPTQSSFARGICFALQDVQPFKLRKTALFFLPLIADKWFNAPDPLMTPDEMKRFCADWASAVNEAGRSASAVQKVALAVLLDMVNSPHWRPHVVPEKRKLLECFSVVPDDSQALRRCLGGTG